MSLWGVYAVQPDLGLADPDSIAVNDAGLAGQVCCVSGSAEKEEDEAQKPYSL
jgi:hypothetical protein